MAQDLIFTAAITPKVTATADLRTFQHYCVVFDSSGVKLASAVGSGPVWVLINKPNSGDACSLLGTPNVVKVYADQAVKYNQPLGLSSSKSGWVTPNSALSIAGTVGVALTAVASGSLVDCYLR